MAKKKINKKTKVSIIVVTISILLVLGILCFFIFGKNKVKTLPSKGESNAPVIESKLKIVKLILYIYIEKHID